MVDHQRLEAQQLHDRSDAFGTLRFAVVDDGVLVRRDFQPGRIGQIHSRSPSTSAGANAGGKSAGSIAGKSSSCLDALASIRLGLLLSVFPAEGRRNE